VVIFTKFCVYYCFISYNCHFFVALFYFIFFIAVVFCVVSRQDERESELRDENSKLHTKYSEVMSYKYISFTVKT